MIGSALNRIATAEKLSVGQLQEAIKNKTIPAYIGIPLLEEKMEFEARMRGSAAARMAQQQQPSIADQVMSAAETRGIDSLPTGLGAAMAGGGIVAFDDGGEVDEPVHFQSGRLVQGQPGFNLPMGGGNIDPQIARAFYVSRGLPIPEELKTPEEKERTPYPAGVFPKIGRFFSDIGKNVGKVAAPGGIGFYSTEATAGLAPSDAAPPAAKRPDAVIPSTAVAPAQAAGEDKALVTKEGAGVIPGQGLRLPAPPTNSSVDFIRSFLEGEPDKGTGERVGGYFQRSEDREKRLMEALGKDRLQGQAFGEYEKALKKEGEQAGLDKDQAKYMALLKAGLSMMAGTSQHALVNIGKGALTGAEDYQTAFKELRKAERERTKEFALIEQARRAEARDDLNRRDQLLMRASDAAQKRDDFGTQALLNAGIEDSRAARDIWKTQFAGGVQLGAAQIRANALGARGAGLTPAQLGRFRQEAMRQIDQNALRAQIAKERRLSKVPAPGADKLFDERVNEVYENEINKYVQRILGGGTTGGLSQGYSLLGTED